MAYNYSFKNQASVDNVPRTLKRIIEDTITMYTNVVPKTELVCIFAQGSLTRGNFKPGVSDFDTTAIVRRELTEQERATFQEHRRSLEKRYQKMGVEKIDGGFVDLHRLLAGEKPKLHFIFSTDGVCIYGKAPALKRSWPGPGNELSKMLNRDSLRGIEQYRNHLQGIKTARDGINAQQWIAKQALRMFFGITMEQSGEYTAKLEKYRGYVKKHLGGELANFDYLYAIYLGGNVRGAELLACCEHVLRLARARGAIG